MLDFSLQKLDFVWRQVEELIDTVVQLRVAVGKLVRHALYLIALL